RPIGKRHFLQFHLQLLHRLHRRSVNVCCGTLFHPLGDVADFQSRNGRHGVEVEPARHARRVARVRTADGVKDQHRVFDRPRHGPELVKRPAERHRAGAGTRPNVGRRPVTPQRIAGLTMLPPVWLPMENATSAEAVAAPGPALDPDAPSSKSHGFIVWPPNQMSLSASAPSESLANSTAPASFSLRTTAESAEGTRLRNGSAPYV